MSKRTNEKKPTERCGPEHVQELSIDNNLISYRGHRKCKRCNTNSQLSTDTTNGDCCQMVNFTVNEDGLIVDSEHQHVIHYAITIKDNLRHHKHEQLASLQKMILDISCNISVGLLDYSFENDFNNKLHIHGLIAVERNESPFSLIRPYMRKGIHLKIDALNGSHHIKRWHQYMHKGLEPYDQVIMEHHVRNRYQFNNPWIQWVDPLEGAIKD